MRVPAFLAMLGVITALCGTAGDAHAQQDERFLRREQVQRYGYGAPPGYPAPGQRGWDRQGGQGADEDAMRRRRLSPDERRDLRRDIRDANKELYQGWPPRRR